MAGASKHDKEGTSHSYYSIPGNRRVVQGTPEEAVNRTHKSDKAQPGLGPIMEEASRGKGSSHSKGSQPQQKRKKTYDFDHGYGYSRKGQWV